MSDPVIEAAQKAWAERYPNGSVSLSASAYQDGLGVIVIAAAREALKPIRELHRRVHSFVYRTDGMCEECDNVWPCETAELIYTTEELER